jgi:hypothetical protein
LLINILSVCCRKLGLLKEESFCSLTIFRNLNYTQDLSFQMTNFENENENKKKLKKLFIGLKMQSC